MGKIAEEIKSFDEALRADETALSKHDISVSNLNLKGVAPKIREIELSIDVPFKIVFQTTLIINDYSNLGFYEIKVSSKYGTQSQSLETVDFRKTSTSTQTFHVLGYGSYSVVGTIGSHNNYTNQTINRYTYAQFEITKDILKKYNSVIVTIDSPETLKAEFGNT